MGPGKLKHVSRFVSGSARADLGTLQVFAKLVAQEAFGERSNRAGHFGLLFRGPCAQKRFKLLPAGLDQ